MLKANPISNSEITKLKKSLRSGDTQHAENLLRSTNNINTLKVFREHKLLLFPSDNQNLCRIYRTKAEELLGYGEELKREIGYLDFLNHFIIETKKINREIEVLISCLLSKSKKEFATLLFIEIDEYLNKVKHDLFESLKEGINITHSIKTQSQFNEYLHNIARGKSLDCLFGVTNLLNIFSGIQNKISFIENVSNYDRKIVLDALSLASRINSYQYAFDCITYGEFFVSSVRFENEKKCYVFSFVDPLLQYARELGLRRTLSQKIIRNKQRWLGDIFRTISDSFLQSAWDFFNKSCKIIVLDNQDYLGARTKIEDSLKHLYSDDELLIGPNIKNDRIFLSYLNAFCLFSYSTVASFLERKSKYHSSEFLCPTIPISEIRDAITNTGLKINVEDSDIKLLTCKLPVTQHLKMFDTPFVECRTGHIFGLHSISQGDWPTWPKSIFMHGGKVGDLVGKVWEEYVANTLRDFKCEKVVQNIRLKIDKNEVTDIDILAKRGNLLMVIQVKVYYGTGINTYEQWKFRKRIEHGVQQATIAMDTLLSNKIILRNYFLENEIAEIKNVKPIIITNSNIFNGWKFQGVSVMSYGSLMQIKNGAKVTYQTRTGEIVKEDALFESDIPTNDEILEMIETPLDWKLAGKPEKVIHHKEESDRSVLYFPLLDMHPDIPLKETFFNIQKVSDV
jgi:hypothetical protein